MEIASQILFIGLWLSAVIVYLLLPNIIPIHYNASGVPNNFGSKTNLLLLPAIGTVIFLLINKLNKHPEIFNYPYELTKENMPELYTNTTRVLRLLKLAILIIFTAIIVLTYLTATGTIQGLGIWFLPLIFLLTLSPTVYYIFKTYSNKRS